MDLVKKFSRLNGTRSFITVFTKTRFIEALYNKLFFMWKAVLVPHPTTMLDNHTF
jgi:hypothetical protein